MMRLVFVALLMLSLTDNGFGHAAPKPEIGAATLLFCAVGSEGVQPIPPIPGQEIEFAEAVVELNNASTLVNQVVSDFTIIDGSRVIRLNHLVGVDEFNKPPRRRESLESYFLNPSRPGPPWDGVLRKGRMRLHIRAAFGEQFPVQLPARCKITIGPYDIEGPDHDGWPT